jgi:hypothetical protein
MPPKRHPTALHDAASADGSSGDLHEATGRPPDDREPVLRGPRLHLDQNRLYVFRPRQSGEAALHHIVIHRLTLGLQPPMDRGVTRDGHVSE